MSGSRTVNQLTSSIRSTTSSTESANSIRRSLYNVVNTIRHASSSVPVEAKSITNSRTSSSTSSSTSTLPPEAYFCQICFTHNTPPSPHEIGGFDNFPIDIPETDSSSSSNSPDSYEQPFTLSCNHKFCESCMVSFISSKINSNDVSLIKCFYDREISYGGSRMVSAKEGGDEVVVEEEIKDGTSTPPTTTTTTTSTVCNAELNENTIESICTKSINPKLFAQYQKFKFDRKNPDSRRCPSCDCANFNSTLDPISSVAAIPMINCTECNTQFCYNHSDAHVGKTCDEFEQLHEQANEANLNYLNTHTRACNICRSMVEKSGGCNQMKCGKCGNHFCWLCGKGIDDSTFPLHYQFWNLTGCPNMQMNESLQPTRATKQCAKIFGILQMVVCGLPSVLLTVVFSISLPCCLPAAGKNWGDRGKNCVSFWGNALTTLVCLPILVVFVVGAIVWFPLLVIVVTMGKIFGYFPEKNLEIPACPERDDLSII